MITVHLSLVGTRVFHGPYREAMAEAQSWVKQAMAGISDEEPTGEQPPNGIPQRCWAAYCSPSANRVFKLIDESPKSLSTVQIAKAAQLSRPSVQRILQAMELQGEVIRIGESGQGRTLMWIRPSTGSASTEPRTDGDQDAR